MSKSPTSLIWVRLEVPQHVLVNFFLQINANSSVGTNHFVGAYARVCRYIASGIGNTYIFRNIANGMVRPFDGSSDKSSRKGFTRWSYGARLADQHAQSTCGQN